MKRRRTSCSWAVGFNGSIERAIRRQWRARRYFSSTMLANSQIHFEDLALTSTDEDLESYLLCFDVIRTEF